MPGADGLTVCRAVRQRPTPYVYVILLTSRDSTADMVEGLDAGADDFLSKPFDAVELRARLRSGERVLALQANLLEAQAALEHQATHDRLTGLWNRGMVLDHLNRTLSQARRARAPVSVVMADLDHFKAVNDSYGHVTGDAVLCEVARRMRSVLRNYDGVGRYGGEEFMLVVSGDVTLARELAERVRKALSATVIADGRSPNCGHGQLRRGVDHRGRLRPDHLDPGRGSGALRRQGRRKEHRPLIQLRGPLNWQLATEN